MDWTDVRIIMAQLRAAIGRISVGWLHRRLERRRRRRWFAELERRPILDAPVSELLGWVPIRIDLAAMEAGWLPGRSLQLRRGHFYETLTQSLASSPPAALRTPVASLVRLSGLGKARPSGFVFHVSRCGSTLLGNMLLGSPRHLVVQEAESFNAVLRERERGSDAERIALVRATAEAFWAARSPEHERLFIKFSSWNVLELPLLRAAFPDVPWLFVYRDPVEVVASNLLRPGGWVREQRDPARASYLSGVAPARAVAMPRAEYCARVVDRYARAALANADPLAHFVDYEQLSEPCLRYVLRAFDVAASESELAAMAAQRSFYSKGSQRERRHREDRGDKQRLARGLRENVEALAGESYRELSRRRAAF
jgi:hypothetical protein